MSKNVLALVIFAACASFRRAGEGFTSTGTAYPIDYFNDAQRAAINAEPKLSVKEVSITDVPDGVDTSRLDAAPADTTPQATKKTTAEVKTKSTSAKTSTSASVKG